ncbi:MAG: hypothetical protein P4L71_10585 [Acetobacteraceae bacterium]|nr:hypothetical protein [Acetobacteraceae bacterium]
MVFITPGPVNVPVPPLLAAARIAASAAAAVVPFCIPPVELLRKYPLSIVLSPNPTN